jgi:aspartyl/glutamyl-tRNA(Asn/Gln) amidotransferase C subunit
MESLSRDKVLYIADLAKISVNEDQIIEYGYELKKMLDEIERINQLDINIDGFLISPSDNVNIYREKDNIKLLSIDEALKNVPTKKGNYIEVVKVIND